jgi:hypothetical protein
MTSSSPRARAKIRHDLKDVDTIILPWRLEGVAPMDFPRKSRFTDAWMSSTHQFRFRRRKVGFLLVKILRAKNGWTLAQHQAAGSSFCM